MALLPRDLQERYNKICSKITELRLPEDHSLLQVIDDIDDRDYIKDPQVSIKFLEEGYSKIVEEMRNPKRNIQPAMQTIKQEQAAVDNAKDMVVNNIVLNKGAQTLDENVTKQEDEPKLNKEFSNGQVSNNSIEQLLSSIISDASRCNYEEGAIIKQKAQELLQECNYIYDVIGAEDYKEEIKNKAERLQKQLNGIVVRYVSEEEAKAYGEWGEE